MGRTSQENIVFPRYLAKDTAVKAGYSLKLWKESELL